ncbi:Protection of telomeres protein 1b [Glycine soja]
MRDLHPLQYNKNVLCALLIVGPILRIVFYKDLMKNHLHLLNVDKWVKFINIRLFAHPSFIKGISFCCTSIMSLILETYDSNLKFSYEITLCFIIIEEVNQDHGMFVTLIFILTHLKVITKFNCVVQMVVTTPCQAKNLLSRVEKYRMQLMVMDSTTRIHVFVTAKDENSWHQYTSCTYSFYSSDVTLYYSMTVIVFNFKIGVKGASRNLSWVHVCLKSFCVSKANVWGNRYFTIFDTKIVGDT